MSSQKYEKAYCVELDEIVTPYEARAIYFDEGHDLYKHSLTFECEIPECDVLFTAVNVSAETFKISPHFRQHVSCTLGHKHPIDENQIVAQKSTSNNCKRLRNTIAEAPEIFVLSRPERKERMTKADNKTLDKSHETVIERKTRALNTHNQSRHKTHYLEHVVDCYENMCKSEKALKNNYLSINGNRRSYKNIFKHVRFFEDGNDFIFFGDVKSIVKYGKNIAIKLNKIRVSNTGEYVSASLYIDVELLAGYRRKKQFLAIIEELRSIDLNEKNVKCYFVGTKPQYVSGETANGKKYQSFKIDIENYDHLVFKWQDKEPSSGTPNTLVAS